MMFVVFDLDGTLALIEHRRHFIEAPKRQWDSFFQACGDDAPNTPIIETAKMFLAAGHRVEIWSGRSDEVRSITQDWLANVGLGDVPLTMRAKGDYTPDDKLKQSWLLAANARPDLIFDDRDKVVAMWRKNKIACAQVAPGDF